MKKRFLLFTTLIFLVAFTFGLKINAEESMSDDYTVTYDVEVKCNQALDTLTINGVEYKANEEDSTKNLKVNGVSAFYTEANENGAYKITDAVRYMLDMAHMAFALDVDGDTVIDELVIAQKTAVKVTNIGSTADKLVTLKTLSDTAYATPKAADISIEVKKDDVLVVASFDGILYAEKITPIETYATKLNATAGKVTLAEGGEVRFNNITVAGAASVDITTDYLGKNNTYIYYVYDDEIILMEALPLEYSFAILKDIVKKEDTLNEVTMKYEIYYEATLIVNGEEVNVILADVGTTIVMGNVDTLENGEADDLTAEEALITFGSRVVNNKPVYYYALISNYEIKEDGKYVITIGRALNEDDVLVQGTISYDSGTKLYTVGDKSKVVLDEKSVIYYTYYKEATGDFKHVGNYTKDTITDKSFYSTALKSPAYLAYNSETKTYTLLAAFVEGEIKGKVEGVITHEEDGTLILYAPEDSIAVYNEADGKIYYEYTFLNTETMQSETVLDTHKTIQDGATATVAGKFYAWNHPNEKYVVVPPSIDTFKLVTLQTIFENNGYILEYNTTDMAAIAEDVVIWGPARNEDGEKTLNRYRTLTPSELAVMLDTVAEHNANSDIIYTVGAILVRTEDFDIEGKYHIKEIILPDIFYTELFEDFGTLVKPSEEETPSTPPEEDKEPSLTKASLSMAGKTARPDTEIEIPLVISDNVGLAGLQLELSYDDALTLEAIEIGDALASLEFTPPGSLAANPITLLLDGQESDDTNGTVFKLIFKAKEDTPEGTYDIKVTVKDAYDNNMNTVEIEDASTKVNVVHYIPGDINGDGEVGARDITMLRRYIAGGYDVTVVEPALDVNRDGEVSARDITMLRRYIAGGYGIELE